MNVTILVTLVVLVAVAVGWLMNRRPWTRVTVFCAAMALVGSIAILARPGPPGTMFYVASFIGPAMGTALVVAGLRHRRV
jgi:hypothetical protein